VSISHDSKFTFTCDGSCQRDQLVVDAKTERNAIAKARRANWNVLRVRARGVAHNKRATTVRRVLCPGCGWLVGVFFR